MKNGGRIVMNVYDWTDELFGILMSESSRLFFRWSAGSAPREVD